MTTQTSERSDTLRLAREIASWSRLRFACSPDSRTDAGAVERYVRAVTRSEGTHSARCIAARCAYCDGLHPGAHLMTRAGEPPQAATRPRLGSLVCASCHACLSLGVRLRMRATTDGDTTP